MKAPADLTTISGETWSIQESELKDRYTFDAAESVAAQVAEMCRKAQNNLIIRLGVDRIAACHSPAPSMLHPNEVSRTVFVDAQKNELGRVSVYYVEARACYDITTEWRTSQRPPDPIDSTE